jgi:AraC-like DNA-binding protein
LNERDIPAPMQYREMLPDPRLRDLVKCYWSLNGWNSEVRTDRILPDGCSELVLHYGDVFEQVDHASMRRQAASLLVGPSTRATLIRPSRRIGIFAVRFRPGGLAILLRTPAAELCDTIQCADQAGVRFGFDAIDAVGSSPERERIRIIEQWLLDRLNRARLDAQIVRLQQCIDDSAGSIRVGELARAAGWSMRQLQRRFQAATGLSPKLLMRLARLQNAWGAVQQNVNFTRAAALAGYADQPHFVREFREFAGVSPSQYLREANQLTEHFLHNP